jgi:hypothetical protein
VTERRTNLPRPRRCVESISKSGFFDRVVVIYETADVDHCFLAVGRLELVCVPGEVLLRQDRVSPTLEEKRRKDERCQA